MSLVSVIFPVAGTPSPAVVRDPQRWRACWNELKEKALKKSDQIVVTCDTTSPLSSETFQARLVCCVRNLPRLNDIKSALRKRSTFRERSPSSLRQMEELFANSGFGEEDTRGPWVPKPTIWKVDMAVDGGITVIDAFSAVKLMHIKNPKHGVMVSSMLHAPFRGFINRQLQIIPVEQPQDILSVRESSLISTDYVWVGFADGSIRLFPANIRRVQEQDQSALLMKGELADIVYEIPKQHTAAVVAITRSPCHDDNGMTDLVTANRLSMSIRELTRATSRGCLEEREHLSLVCTASEDSCVVVWSLQKIYRRLEEMRLMSRSSGAGRFGLDSSASSLRGDVVTFNVRPVGTHSGCTVRSTCILVKVRPVFRLKGGVGGLRTLRWATTLVTTVGYEKSRDVVAMTRDPKESTAPQLLKRRRAFQQVTRWEKREEHRIMMQLSENRMREVEEKLEQLMPPLAREPEQRRRVNLIIAGDVHGTVHFWDLDEELEKGAGDNESAASTPRTRSVSRESRSGRSASLSNFDFSVSPRRRPTMDAMSSSARSSVERSNGDMSSMTGLQEVSHRPWEMSGTKSKRRKRCVDADILEKEQQVSSTPRNAKKSGRVKKEDSNNNNNNSSVHHQHKHQHKHQHPPSTPKQSTKKNPASYKRKNSASRRSSLPAGGASLSLSQLPIPIGKGRRESNSAAACSSSTQNPGPGQMTARPSRPIAAAKPPPPQQQQQPPTKPAISRAVETPRSPMTQLSNGRRILQIGVNKTSLTSAKSPRRTATKFTDHVEMPKSGKKKSDANMSSISKPRMSRCFPSGSIVDEVNKSIMRDRQSVTEHGSSWTVHWNSSRMSNSNPFPFSGRYSISGRQSPCDSAQSARSEEEVVSNEWVPAHKYMNNMYSRKAKCHMDLIDGGTVTGIAIDLPPVIRVTMRCLPDPPEPHYSLLEDPTEDEIRHRTLANCFYPLTDERALYYVFERMQFYVSVERTVMNINCIPKASVDMLEPRFYTKKKLERGIISEPVPFNFEIVFRRHVLEMHPQPISCMFIDHPRHQLWVARSDGMLSIFSTETKSIVTRVPHPSSETPLGPPNLLEWKRFQRCMMMGRHSFPLKIHKECKKYPPGHFIGFRPVSVTQEFELMRISVGHQLNSMNELHSTSQPVDKQLMMIDGVSTLDEHAQSREIGLYLLLEKLKICRQNAVSVRRAQKEYYYSLFNASAERVRRVVGRCATFTALPMARKLFLSWKHHRDYFPRHYVLRQIRKKRVKQLACMANVLALSFDLVFRRRYFSMWLTIAEKRRISRNEEKIGRFLNMSVSTNMRNKYTTVINEYTQRRRYWYLWRSAINVKLRPSSHTTFCPSGGSPPNNMASTQVLSSQSLLSPWHYSGLRARSSEPNTVFNNIYAIICQIHSFRGKLIHFRLDENADSVIDIDDVWFDSIEAATSEAETKTAYALKLAVFRFGLIPFLESVLLTAEEMLPKNSKFLVNDGVQSMIQCCLLCVDYLYADADAITPPGVVKVIGNGNNTFSEDSLHFCARGEGSEILVSEGLEQEREIRQFFDDAMDDRESQAQIEAISTHRAVIEEFLRICLENEF